MRQFSISIRDLYETTRARKIGTISWLWLALAFVAFAGLMTLFVELVEEVGEGDTLSVDEAILRWFEHLQTPWLDQFFSLTTDLGGTIGVVAIVIVTLGLLLWGHRRRAALQFGLGITGAVGLNLILKNIFTRARPDLWEQIVIENSYSFPSGHAMASSALAFSFIVIFWQTKYRWPVTMFALIYMVFVGVTRLYLGVHYPSDIMAGWTMSAIWVTVVAVLIGTLRVRRKA